MPSFFQERRSALHHVFVVLDVDDPRYHGEEGGDEDERVPDGRGRGQETREEGGQILEEKDGNDGRHLGNGLRLAPVVGGDDPTLLHRPVSSGLFPRIPGFFHGFPL